jgi:hypothetical protein
VRIELGQQERLAHAVDKGLVPPVSKARDHPRIEILYVFLQILLGSLPPQQQRNFLLLLPVE